jgi:hypothetical protein
MVYLAAAAASLLVVSVTLLTFSTSPANAPLLRVPHGSMECCASRHGSWLRLRDRQHDSRRNPGLLFSRMFRNSLATRPTAAGALYGAGADLAINAGWRIACPISTLWHTLGAHGAAIIATVLLGAPIGRYLGNRSCTSATDVPKRLGVAQRRCGNPRP